MNKKKYITKECKHHGETQFLLESRGYYRCTKCMREAVTRNRVKAKQKAVDYKGGKCFNCGYSKCNDALEFHHIDGNTKEFGISDGQTRKWERVEKELDKCVLVCANCHREIHAGILSC